MTIGVLVPSLELKKENRFKNFRIKKLTEMNTFKMIIIYGLVNLMSVLSYHCIDEDATRN